MKHTLFVSILTILLFGTFLPCKAQQSGIFFELGGSAGLASINYETSILTGEKTDLKLRFGFSTFPVDKNNGWSLMFPVMAELLLGPGKHKLELGWGQTLTVTTKGRAFIQMPAVLGYRYQKPGKRLFYRISYTPIISYIIDFQYQNWGGLSIGYRFK